MRRFTVSFPRQWMPIDLQAPLEPQLEPVVSWYVSQAPAAKRGVVEKVLRDQLLKMASAMAKDGALSLILPVDQLYSRLSALMAFTPVPHEPGEDPFDQLILLASADDTAQLFDLDSAVGLRTQADLDVTEETQTGLEQMTADLEVTSNEDATCVVDPSIESGDRVMQRRVTYYLGVPQEPDSWVQGAFMFKYDNSALSTKGADDVMAMMDAVMKSFRWEESADE